MRRRAPALVGSRAPGPVVSGQALIEGVSVRGGMGPLVPGRGRIDGDQLGLRRTSGGGDRRRMFGDAQVPKNRAHDRRVGEKGEDAHLAMTGGTAQRVHFVGARKELGAAPRGPRSIPCPHAEPAPGAVAGPQGSELGATPSASPRPSPAPGTGSSARGS